jgi:hypothetical protein
VNANRLRKLPKKNSQNRAVSTLLTDGERGSALVGGGGGGGGGNC